MPKAILAEQSGSSGGSGVQLMALEVTTAPTKTSYLAGDSFDTSGMIVTASYGTGTTIFATAEVSGYSISPSTLSDGDTQVTISYSEGGTTVSTTQSVTVTHKVKSLAITTSATTTSYEYGDTLSTSGMVVKATYSDSTTSTITNYTCSPTSLTTVGTQTITVSYTENNVTVTASYTVSVARKSVSKPTWKSNLTYSGSSQSVTSTSYWNNYNTTYMSMSGTTSATNAGTYSATFTLGSNYRWTDGTTTATSVSWTINKATGSLSLSATTASIDGTNYSSGVAITVTRSGDGTISASSSNSTACPVSISGTTVTVKGDGSMAGTFTITVSVAEGTNYTAPTDATITVTALYWEWGTETDVGDATWWAGLKSWAATATASERAAVVGKTKRMSLSTSVLGATHFLMRCIGADQDGTGTLAFNAVYAAPTTTAFSSSSAAWIGSSARTYCQNIYSYCSAKNSIKTVSKGTCASTNDSRARTVTYNNETVFLLSEREYGLNTYSPISTANSTTSNAECTKGYNASYSYYSSNSTRIMYRGNAAATASSGNLAYQWERSRSYYSSYSNRVCFVDSVGGASWANYDYSTGLAPAFIIG